MNKVLGAADLVTEDAVIQAHSAMKTIYHETVRPNQNEIVLVGGGDRTHEICD